MADSNYKGKNYETAKLYFDTLINLSADSGVYYFKRGYSKMMTLKYAPGSIINDFHSSLINGYSNKEAVYLDMGLMFRLVDRSDSALYYLDKCLEIHPDEKKAIDLKKEIELSLQNPIQRGT
jgi:tetratricopeptide (TPR) repeat protein